jgi:hypothetical protein
MLSDLKISLLNKTSYFEKCIVKIVLGLLSYVLSAFKSRLNFFLYNSRSFAKNIFMNDITSLICAVKQFSI